MTLTLEVIIGILTAMGLLIGLACYLFYTKSEVDKKLSDVKDENKTFQNELKKDIDSRIEEVKDLIYKNEKEVQENQAKAKDEIHDKLTENKQALEDGMKQFVQLLADIKEADKDMSIQFISMINAVKEELKNDYTSRYNDLLVLINAKANESDFIRLENKFDKITETMVELKTVVQMKLEDKTK